jgi:hypothetical protein
LAILTQITATYAQYVIFKNTKKPKLAKNRTFWRKIKHFMHTVFTHIHTITIGKNSIAMCEVRKPFILERFEPTLFNSDGGDEDHYTTPPAFFVNMDNNYILFQEN